MSRIGKWDTNHHGYYSRIRTDGHPYVWEWYGEMGHQALWTLFRHTGRQTPLITGVRWGNHIPSIVDIIHAYRQLDILTYASGLGNWNILASHHGYYPHIRIVGHLYVREWNG